MKAFVSFVVFFFAASLCLAQGRNILINRIDKQLGDQLPKSSQVDPSVVTGSKEMPKLPGYFHVCLDQRTKSALPAGAQEKTFEITMGIPRIRLGLNDYGSITGQLKNLTSEPIKLIFKRTQIIPAGWSTSVCFGDACYPDFIDSLKPESPYTLEGNSGTEFKLNIASAPDVEDSVIAYVRVTAVGSSEDDTVGLLMVAFSEGGEGVNGSGNRINRSSIVSIYPSPLISGSSINVSVVCAKEVSYRYAIYDPFGRELAFGTSQRKLASGNNVFSIGSLEGMSSGNYLLRLHFSDGSSDTYPFSVIR